MIFLFLFLYSVWCLLSSNIADAPKQWEYKTLIVYREAIDDFTTIPDVDHGVELDSLGSIGWELVDVCTEVGSVLHNNDNYISDLQPNVRTTVFYYYFKRPILNGVMNDSISVIIKG